MHVGVGPVLDHAGDQLGVRDDDAGAVEGLDLGRAHADAPHVPVLASHRDLVADAHRPFGEQDQAGHEVRHDRLQAEADADRERAGDQCDLLQVDAEVGEREGQRRDEADIPDDGRDRELQARLDPGARQEPGLQPALQPRVASTPARRTANALRIAVSEIVMSPMRKPNTAPCAVPQTRRRRTAGSRPRIGTIAIRTSRMRIVADSSVPISSTPRGPMPSIAAIARTRGVSAVSTSVNSASVNTRQM